MKVICISERKSNFSQIEKGQFYKIDIQSIWIDSDGDAYGSVYDENGVFIGNMLLKHFKSV